MYAATGFVSHGPALIAGHKIRCILKGLISKEVAETSWTVMVYVSLLIEVVKSETIGASQSKRSLNHSAFG